MDADAPPAPGDRANSRPKARLAGLIVAVVLALGLFLLTLAGETQLWSFTVAYSIIDPLLAVGAAYWAWNSYQQRRWLHGTLSLLFALLMTGWTVQNWVQLAVLLHEAH